MLHLHAPADQQQAASVNWLVIAIGILGLQVLCFASLLMQVQLSTFGFTGLICAVGRLMFWMGLGSFDRFDVWSAANLKQPFNALAAWL